MKLIKYVLLISLMIFLVGCISNERLTEKAIEQQDISYCNKIKDQGTQNRCFFKLADYVPEACSHIEPFYCLGSPCMDESGLIAECYEKLFEKNPSEQVCIDMEANKGAYQNVLRCFEKLGFSGNSLCKKFKTSYSNFWGCFRNKLGNGLDVPVEISEEECIEYAKISEDNKWRCYKDLAVTEKNEKFCNKDYMSNTFNELACLLEVAKAKKDTEVCNKIDPSCYKCGHGISCGGGKPTGNWVDCDTYQNYCKKQIESSS
ncbi:MAG: hypothetical protein GY861_23540 [bacterium]|nr:hypothetical protein [bacterium]